MVWDREGDRIYRETLKSENLIDDSQTTKIMRKFGVPLRFLKCRIETIPDDGSEYRGKLTAYVENVVRYDEHGHGLVLIGPFGSGKTGAAAALIYEVTRRWGKCRFVSARDLGRIANDYSPDKQRQWKDLRRYQFVVIDEIGCEEKNKDSRESQLIKQATEDLVRHRYDSQLATIITSNMQVDALMARYECLASLFMDAYDFVAVTGVDWRGN
jgi:DNA replication protein DnaC